MLNFKFKKDLQCLKGDKVKLRPLQRKDYPEIKNWFKDIELLEYSFGIYRNTPLFSSLQKSYQKDVFARSYRYFAIETLEGDFIGFVNYSLEKKSNICRIGIVIGKRGYWSKGFGRDAIMTLLDYLFFVKKVAIVELDTADFNYRAQRCFEKCGFKKQVHISDADSHQKLFGRKIWYSMKKEDYLSYKRRFLEEL